MDIVRIVLKTLFIVLAVIWLASCSEEKEVSLSPQQALSKFYAHPGAEDQLMNPLILSGADVVPLLLTEIESKDMPRRRYAIGALGNIQDKAALGLLEEILDDDSENDYFRCDALNSIGMIDFQRGKELASHYLHSSIDCLSTLSTEILVSEYDTWLSRNYMRRTIEEARSGKHY